MASKVRIQRPSQTGAPLNVYGQLTADGTQVLVWTKHQTVGFYNLSRFDGGTLTTASMRGRDRACTVNIRYRWKDIATAAMVCTATVTLAIVFLEALIR